jgi:hypothetical protein
MFESLDVTMQAVLFTEGETGEMKCGVCEQKIDHGWSVNPQSFEEEEFLGTQFSKYVEIWFCDIHLEDLKKECETNRFSIKIIKDDKDISDWVVDPHYLSNESEKD